MRRIAGAAALAPTAAAAHTFDPGADVWAQILASALVPVGEPAILLVLLPLGLLAGLWRSGGAAEVWPTLAAGLVAGSLAGGQAGLWIAFAAILLGLALSLMAAASLDWPGWAVRTAAGAGGLAAGAAAFEAHPLGSLPGTAYLGVFVGGLALPLGVAALVEATRARWPARWVAVAWRVAASWTGAVAMMLAALRFA